MKVEITIVELSQPIAKVIRTYENHNTISHYHEGELRELIWEPHIDISYQKALRKLLIYKALKKRIDG